MKKTTFYIGLQDKNTKKQEISTENALEIVTDIFLKYSPFGATISADNRGIYHYEDGTIAREKTVSAFVLGLEEENILAIASACKTALNQESILIIQTEEDVLFA